MAKKKLPNLLPKKLSDCIDVALADLDAAKAQGMRVDMDRWYKKDYDGKCSVCLAGAVMAREFELEPGEIVTPHKLIDNRLISIEDAKRLEALDLVRQSDLNGALRIMGYNEFVYDDHNFEGEEDTTEWRSNMKNIAASLKSIGQ